MNDVAEAELGPQVGGFASITLDPESTLLDRELHLASIADVRAGLAAIDWSFTDAETRVPGHDVHPYPAKFIPQIPANLISCLSSRGDMIFDPFGGSGTTALEAVRLGRRAISVDANPLSALIGRVKTARLDQRSIKALHLHHGALLAELQGGNLDPLKLIPLWDKHAPSIKNREKWFADSAYAELLLIKARIAELDGDGPKDIAHVALSRMVIRASFQDSETRYKSVPRDVPQGETLKRYLKEFNLVLSSVSKNAAATRFGISRFICADIRHLDKIILPDGIADLVVTSPPYGNATDYHLYHRFRLLWLGFDPIALGHVEIGSHLKHQREKSGFDSYLQDMGAALDTMCRALKPERYAALVIGDSVYEGTSYDPAEALGEQSESFGFDFCTIVDRPIHSVKRSFAHAGRRATSEHILVLRRKPSVMYVQFSPPPYKLWPYERELRFREIGVSSDNISKDDTITIASTKSDYAKYKRLVFSHSVKIDGFDSEPTWQAIIENGGASCPSARKDPKYVTHGIHPYKGKFYPQLAKGLLNLADIPPGSVVLDPFCGSGTTLLEGYLNGHKAYGCDMNPLAAKIARAKVGVLEVESDVLTEVITTLKDILAQPPSVFPKEISHLSTDCQDEISRWFAGPVIAKLDWLIGLIRRASAGATLDFLEIILSSIIRDISQQDPSDLRVRYRKDLLLDANVIGMFSSKLDEQFERIEKFWKVRGSAPHGFCPATIVEGDNRKRATFEALGLRDGSVDLVLTSPPYGTALPYIDTDRLSLLTLLGYTSAQRRPVESGLIGSREIGTVDRRRLEETKERASLPKATRSFLTAMAKATGNDATAGCRKKNAPALMTRYLLDMKAVIENAFNVLKPNGEMMMVIGDNRTQLNGKTMRVPCTDMVEEIAIQAGFLSVERIDIAVTTENLRHMKNAILENVVLRLKKPN